MAYVSSSGSSSYWQLYLGQIEDKRKEKKVYDDALPIIEQLASGLPEIKGELDGAMQDCMDGGYVEGGAPYGQGKFESSSEELGNAISSLATAVSTVNGKIQEYNGLIKDLQLKYASARRSYDHALTRERLAAQKKEE